MFGNRSTDGLMTFAIERAQESFKQVQELGIFDPLLVEQDSLKLVRDSYVDDIHTGGSQGNIDRLMGTLDSYNKFTGSIPSFLNNVGLKPKTEVLNSSKYFEANKGISGCALGYF